jgi:Domain of unknown function (DUF6379)
MANIFGTIVLGDELRVAGSTACLSVRLPWYRSLPLSTFEVTELQIDGRAMPPSAMRLRLNGKSFGMKEVADRTDEQWYVLDAAELAVESAGLAPGTTHQIDLTVTLYPPYIPGLAWAVKSSKRLTAAAMPAGRSA